MPGAPTRDIRRGRRDCCRGPATRGSRMHDGIRHTRHPHHRLDVVHSDDVGAAGDAERDRRRGALEPLVGRQVERLADERLARRADQQGKSEPAQLGQALDDLQVLFPSLPESDPRIHDDAVLRDPGGPSQLSALAQVRGNLANQVAIAASRLVVHQHHRHPRPGDGGRHLWIPPQSPNIVHHGGTGCHGSLGNCRLVRVDRDRYRDAGHDARRRKAGDCVGGVPGTQTDGHRYVETALRDGAVAAVVTRRVGTAWPQVVVPDTRQALAQMSSTWYRHPSRELVVIGVTGTDGKTTTTTMIQHMLRTAGRPAGSMSTVDIRYGDNVDPNDSRQTTLEALEIQEQLARMRDAGLKYVVIETSSHGLALQRVVGVDYDVATFTNIAHEHLDFHKTTEAYQEAKARLIDLTAGSAAKGVTKTAVLNRDDPSYAYLVNRAIARQITYGVQMGADLKAATVEATADGLHLEASTPLGPLGLRLKLSGRWNAANALAAAAVGIAVGLPLEEMRNGLERFSGVSGRMERGDLGQPFNVIIDYAHTPQSLEKVLRELRH